MKTKLGVSRRDSEGRIRLYDQLEMCHQVVFDSGPDKKNSSKFSCLHDFWTGSFWCVTNLNCFTRPEENSFKYELGVLIGYAYA